MEIQKIRGGSGGCTESSLADMAAHAVPCAL